MGANIVAPPTYTGYIPAPPGANCPPQPHKALEQCIRAAQQALEDTLQTSDLASWIHPPYRARYISDHARAVVSATSGFDSGTNAAGSVLQAANNAIAACQLLEQSSATDYKTIWNFQVPSSYILRVATWGVTVVNHVPEALSVQIVSGSSGGLSQPPDAFLGGHETDRQQPTFLLVQGGQTLTINVLNNDVTNAPLLVHFGITGWLFPLTKRMDDPKSVARLRSGIGLSCK